MESRKEKTSNDTSQHDDYTFARALEETPPQTDNEGGATSSRTEDEGERVRRESQEKH